MTIYESDRETVVERCHDGITRKMCEWKLINDTTMTYTAFNLDGTVNTYHVHHDENKEVYNFIFAIVETFGSPSRVFALASVMEKLPCCSVKHIDAFRCVFNSV